MTTIPLNPGQCLPSARMAIVGPWAVTPHRSHGAEASPSPVEVMGCGSGSGCHYSPEVKNTPPADLLPYVTEGEQNAVPSSARRDQKRAGGPADVWPDCSRPRPLTKWSSALEATLVARQSVSRNRRAQGRVLEAGSERVPTSFSNCPSRSLQPHELALSTGPAYTKGSVNVASLILSSNSSEIKRMCLKTRTPSKQ